MQMQVHIKHQKDKNVILVTWAWLLMPDRLVGEQVFQKLLISWECGVKTSTKEFWMWKSLLLI